VLGPGSRAGNLDHNGLNLPNYYVTHKISNKKLSNRNY